MSASNDKADHEPDVTATDFKQKYKLLKSKLKLLVYEHEALLDDLKKAQKKLLRVSRDRSFLLDRLLTFEKVEDSSSDDDDDIAAAAAAAAAGAENESDGGGGREKPAARVGKKADAAGPEKARKREGRASGGSGELAKKRLKTIKKPRGAGASNGVAAGPVPAAGTSAAGGAGPVGGAGGGAGAGVGTAAAAAAAAAVSPSAGAAGVALLPKSSSSLQSSVAGGGREDSAERRRPRADQARPKAAAAATASAAGASSTTVAAAAAASGGAVPPLSREEIERHLESRPRPLALEKAPLHMPAEIFSNEASSADSDDAVSDELDPSDLIIDTKWDA